MKVASLQGPLEVGWDYRRYVQASKADQALPPFFNPAKPHNIGDWFLTKVVDRILDYDELLFVQKNATDADWELVNSECDVLVLRGGNYIDSRWFTTFVGEETLAKIKIPIVMFGAGLQVPAGQRPSFAPEEKEALKRIAGSCALLALRGPSTEEALHGIGIDNTIVTGCPTLFWSRKPVLDLKPAGYGHTGFTFRKTLYTTRGEMSRAQFEAMDLLRRRSGRTTVFAQGEEVALQRWLQATQWGAEFEARMEPLPGRRLQVLRRRPMDAAYLREEVHAQFDRHHGPELVDWLLENSYFSWDIDQMIARYREVDLMVGCRLHGNLLALANGTPAYYLTYDERTREIVELLQLPSSPVDEVDPGVDFAAHDWRPAQRRYEECYRLMLRFLEANGLRHRMAVPGGGDLPEPALAGAVGPR
jgi:hypothetical protein